MKKFRSILRRNHSHDSPSNPHFDEVTEEIANEYCEANGVPMQRVSHEDDHQFDGEEATSHYHLVIEEGHQRDIHRAIVLHPSIQFPVHAREVAVKRVLVLYNPESGAHKGEKIALKAIAIMRSSGVDVQSIPLERRGHGEEICKTVDLKSFDVVTFIGGDGTIHECINGLMKRSDSEGRTIPVAIIAAGTGNSFSLELTGGTNMKTAVHKILAGVHVPIDIAKVTQFEVGPNGQMDKDVMYSFNSLHWGLASRVNVTAEKLRWMGKAVRYTTAGLVELFKGEQTLAKIKFEEADGKVTEYEDKFCLAIANNIVTAAKGMKMAPRAKLNDGLIDLLLIRSSKTLDLVSVFSKVYDGTHTQLDFVEYVQVKWFTIVPYKDNGRPLVEGDPEVAEELVDVDGELKGATPLICQVMPLAIKVII